MADVSNDLSFNPIFGIAASTKFGDATVRVGDVDVIEIENLPALTPLDSSVEYAGQLFPHLLELIAGELPPGSVWENALLTYYRHHDIPQLAMECGRELGELFSGDPDAVSVGFLRGYFADLFAKNPLSRTDRLYFVDHLMSGVAEILPAAAQETVSARLAKAELDAVYDAPPMRAHHALLETVYAFSRSREFPEAVAAEHRDGFFDLCDLLSAGIDDKPGAGEEFACAREGFLQKLGTHAEHPALVRFLHEAEALSSSPS